MNTVNKDVRGLRELRESLRAARSNRAQVGIFGDKAQRLDSDWNKTDLNNPTIGLIQEFGVTGGFVNHKSRDKYREFESNAPTMKIPARSFLRVPLQDHLFTEVKKIGFLVWREMIVKRSVVHALDALGITAFNIVQRAFATAGFGKWAPNAPSTIAKKGSSKPLIDTAELRQSIHWRVKTSRANYVAVSP